MRGACCTELRTNFIAFGLPFYYFFVLPQPQNILYPLNMINCSSSASRRIDGRGGKSKGLSLRRVLDCATITSVASRCLIVDEAKYGSGYRGLPRAPLSLVQQPIRWQFLRKMHQFHHR